MCKFNNISSHIKRLPEMEAFFVLLRSVLLVVRNLGFHPSNESSILSRNAMPPSANLVKPSDLGSEVCVSSSLTGGTYSPVAKLVVRYRLKICCL